MWPEIEVMLLLLNWKVIQPITVHREFKGYIMDVQMETAIETPSANMVEWTGNWLERSTYS